MEINPSPLIAIHWFRFQARTRGLAGTLGGQAHFVGGSGWLDRHKALLPLRYLRDSLRTWRILQVRNPTVVLAVTPPVFVPMVAWVWCAARGRRLMIDCHTGAFYSWKWRWAVPILRWVTRRSKAVLVHTERDEAMVAAWGAPSVLVPDDLPDIRHASSEPLPARPRVLVAGSFDADEPVALAFKAAALLLDVEFRFTGDVRRLPIWVRTGIPPNAYLTGYLPYHRFLGELLAAHVVAVFTTHPHAANRAAFEAVGLGRPLVCSDVPALRARFGSAALFCANDPAAMGQGIRQALREQAALVEKSCQVRAEIIAQREAALERLVAIGIRG